jgi:Ca2+-binding RTX toxin-like protein
MAGVPKIAFLGLYDWAGGVMVELIGLMAALFAGLLSSGLGGEAEAENDNVPDQDDVQNIDPSNGLDFGYVYLPTPGDAGNVEGMPQSSDAPVVADADETMLGDMGNDILFGLGGDDWILGSDGDDSLGGRAGDDTLLGGFDEDYLVGGDGNDSLDGGADADTLYGDDGQDTLIGAAGEDALYAGAGQDMVTGDAGQDNLFGGQGQDSLYGGEGDDTVDGGLGNDSIAGGAGGDELFGGAGADTLWGSAPGQTDSHIDFLNGGEGDDVLMLGAGDYGHGDAGADSFALVDASDGGTAVQISDFDPGEDQLIMVYDPALGPAPTPSLQQDGAGNTEVLLDGHIVAILTNGANINLSNILVQAE